MGGAVGHAKRSVRGLLGRGALAALGAAFAAGPALAAEGNIVLLPDWSGKLPAMVLLLALLIFPLNALLFRPVLRALDAREERIAGTRARAGKLAGEADALLARYEQAIRETREEAERERRASLGEARARAAAAAAEARAATEREIESARRRLAEEAERARGALRPQVAALAREAAARVLGRPLS
jgi:F-type H+-transporting ATPase subunit b